MKIFLAGPSSKKFLENEYSRCRYILESFYSMTDWLIPIIKNCEFFLLDSGAFTFMNSKKGVDVNFNDYLTKYIDFINEFIINK